METGTWVRRTNRVAGPLPSRMLVAFHRNPSRGSSASFSRRLVDPSDRAVPHQPAAVPGKKTRGI